MIPLPDAAPLPPPPRWQGPHFVEVVATSRHACARTDAGEVYCWGDDTGLQLGEGLVHRHTCGPGPWRGPCRPFAAPVPVLEGAVQLTADGRATCARRADGSVACTGQLPVPLPSLPPVVQLTMGVGLVCGITASADLICIDPLSGERRVDAAEVTDVAATVDHFCYVQRGRVWCGGSIWPEPEAFFVGRCGSVESRDGCLGAWVDLPVQAVDVGVALGTTCVRTVDDEVYCWGYLDEVSAPPTHVAELDGPATELVVGTGYACVLRPNGDLDCHHALRPGPVLDHVVSVELEPAYGCAVTEDGAVSCWGENESGQLGRGSLSAGIRPSADHVRLDPAADWTPRSLPTPTEVGWVPYPTLGEDCVIERAERPELLGPFPVGPCGVSTCMRLETPTGARVSLGDRVRARGLGGVMPFLTFTATHRIYGLVSIATGEVLAAVRSPADFARTLPDGEHDFCIVDALAVGGGQAVLALRSDPFPIRVIHAPIESLRDVSTPTEIGRTNLFGEEVFVGARAFTIQASSGLEIHDGPATRTHFSLGLYPDVEIIESTIVWHNYRDRRLWAANGLGDAVALFELPTGEVVSGAAAEPGRVAWTQRPDVAIGPLPPAELWTAALSNDLSLMDATSLGEVEAPFFAGLAIGEGQIAFVAGNDDLVLRSVADGSERRLAPSEPYWGEVWYIADGYVVTGGRSTPVARTPIDAMPLVSP